MEEISCEHTAGGRESWEGGEHHASLAKADGFPRWEMPSAAPGHGPGKVGQAGDGCREPTLCPWIPESVLPAVPQLHLVS